MMSSPARMIALAAVVTAVLGAQPAVAAWDGQVLLAFGETYRSGDGRAVHRGVDVAATSGDIVDAPAGGVVSFVGRVPGQAGGLVLAVSIDTGSDVISISPLERVEVARGQAIAQGEDVGTVAGGGDPSSPQPHVHLSLRREGVYLDPRDLLTSPPASEVPAVPVVGVPTPATAVSADPAPTPSMAAPGAIVEPVPTPVPVQVVAPTPIMTAEPMSAAVPQALSAPVATTTRVGDGPVVSVPAESGAMSGVESVRWPDLATSGMQRTLPAAGASLLARAGEASLRTFGAGPVGQVPGPARGTPAARPASGALRAAAGTAATPIGFACLATMLLAVAFLFSRRVLERRILFSQPVSDRFGSMLQHLRAGDTLCGLTSCSGLLPSQSRGRLAQRR